ncbi:MAG TPA: M6 family metalloprotease domain-containing protein [Gaiellaceae bacterium]|nr:M6 family metalloprotease domain-containing protein [Gaiellaceae bacterium]
MRPVARPTEDAFDVARCLEILALHDPYRCTVAPSPDLSEKIRAEVERLQGQKRVRDLTSVLKIPSPKAPGLNDGLIVPGSYFPLGTSVERVRWAAAARAPLHGTLRVIVVLVDFDDEQMTETVGHFEDLFFSTGVLPNGSVKEYYAEVTNGLVDITGDVVGPYRMPLDMTEYAHGASGIGSTLPNARTMARDAAGASDPDVNFGPYDNDGNGFVDAFIVVHAGPGAEQTGNANHIWSHKWVLSGGEYVADTAKIYAYLTVPEDARIGVCAHELGHLLFGLPDLYDTDNTSEGIGNWCLMAGGSWNGGGDVPAHASAWCKADQAWATVQNVTTNGSVNIADVKDAHTIYRLWKDGASGQEYFLVENRQQDRFDANLPGEGLLIWHIDEAISNNTDEAHYKVALEQADGNRDLENNVNRGDAGDPFPGSSGNTAFSNTSTPNSQSYGGLNTCVSVTGISVPGPVMTAYLAVRCGKAKEWTKDLKDIKERRKEFFKEKEFRKEFKELKEGRKEFKELKEGRKEFKEPKEIFEKRWETGLAGAEAQAEAASLAELEARVAALEAQLGAAEPFIEEELRPDLLSGLLGEEGATEGELGDKRSYDSKPPEA